jgi:CDP-6-deoxy-D-xylo-4-hexulose-3-dehydrase
MAESKNGTSWQKVITDEWISRRAAEPPEEKLFPLAMNPFGEEEIVAMTEVLLSGKLTLGANVEKAEKLFAAKVGAPYAVLVNSGSSANLLAVSAIVNKFRPVHCDAGDEVLVPAVSWSTSVFPLIQCGLKPKFVDTDPKTFNVSIELLEKAMTPRVKAVMAVHVLGNSICMKDLQAFVKKHNLMLVEDTCESLGSYYQDENGNKKMLGTLGDFGCYSFYFSHHITSGEGGAVVCKTEEDYNFVRCLRAHGWTRHLTNRAKVESDYPKIDPRFLFVNLGYNLRPMEVQGAMLIVQLAKLDEFNSIRRDNLVRIRTAFEADARFPKTMKFMEASEGVDPAWFGIAVLLNEEFSHHLDDYLAHLTANGIENRPIISGNFIRQPSIAMYCKDEKPQDYPGSESIHNRGFFIGVHQVHVPDEKVKKLVALMLDFEFSAEKAGKKARTE